MLDLVTLLVCIYFEILIAIYRTFKPLPFKNLHGELAMVIRLLKVVYRLHAQFIRYLMYCRLWVLEVELAEN